MVNITINEDCGNAPKKLFLNDFIVAVVQKDSSFMAATVTDDIRWSLVGGLFVDGKPAVLAELHRSRGDKVLELIVNTIVTHGYNGVIEGLLKFKGGKTIAFCDVYQFRASTNNAPIKKITTYAIELI